ncbi:MAG: hypothetical protein R2791_17925 [Saprospiraceae bacterium]|nr:hypothetical protein [Saprospiraceae bacterium]
MKKINTNRFPGRVVMLVACVFCYATLLSAQSDGGDEDSGKSEAIIECRFKGVNNRTIVLEAIVKTKEDDSYVRVEGTKVNFYLTDDDTEKPLGTSISNGRGVAALYLPENAMPPGIHIFTASIENDPRFIDSREEVSVKGSNFNMSLESEGSARQVHITLSTTDDEGNEIPAPEVDVNLYVKRMFGLLRLSEDPETTDEDGEIVADFPEGIPGDTSGNLIVVAQVEEHEDFGTLIFQRKINWGIPLKIDPIQNERELWSSRANAPLYLIAIVNSMLIGIWGVILYVVYLAFRIKKLGRKDDSVSHAH